MNNGIANPVDAHARENVIPPNELLTEMKNGKTVDIGATDAAIGNDSAMATVGEINRTTYTRG